MVSPLTTCLGWMAQPIKLTLETLYIYIFVPLGCGSCWDKMSPYKQPKFKPWHTYIPRVCVCLLSLTAVHFKVDCNNMDMGSIAPHDEKRIYRSRKITGAHNVNL